MCELVCRLVCEVVFAVEVMRWFRSCWYHIYLGFAGKGCFCHYGCGRSENSLLSVLALERSGTHQDGHDSWRGGEGHN